MNQKRVLFFVIVMLVSVTFLMTPAESAGESVITLKYAYLSSPMARLTKLVHQGWTKQVEEKAKGKLVIQHYPSSSLFKQVDSFKAVKGGITDLCWTTLSFFPGQFPLAEVMSLPFLGIPSAEAGSQVLWKLYEKFPELQKEFKGVKVLALNTTSPYFLASNRPVANLNDLKGLKIRTAGGPGVELWKNLGAVPVTLPTLEQYLAAQRGIIDGAGTDWGPFEHAKLYESWHNWTDVKLFVHSQILMMNQEKWNSLPAELKEVLNSLSGLYGSTFYGKTHYDTAASYVLPKLEKMGIKMNRSTLDAAELSEWRNRALPVWEKWKDRCRSKNLNGEKILEEAQRLIGDYK